MAEGCSLSYRSNSKKVKGLWPNQELHRASLPRYLASLPASEWSVWLASRALFAKDLTLGSREHERLGICGSKPETILRVKPSDCLFKILFVLLLLLHLSETNGTRCLAE